MHRLYANFMTFYIRDFGILRFLYPQGQGEGSWDQSPVDTKGGLYTYTSICMHVHVCVWGILIYSLQLAHKVNITSIYIDEEIEAQWQLRCCPISYSSQEAHLEFESTSDWFEVHEAPPVVCPTVEKDNCSSLYRWVQHTSLLASEVWPSGFWVVCRPTGTSKTSRIFQVQLVAVYLGCDGSFLDNEPAPPGTPFNLLEHVEKFAYSAWYCYIKYFNTFWNILNWMSSGEFTEGEYLIGRAVWFLLGLGQFAKPLCILESNFYSQSTILPNPDASQWRKYGLCHPKCFGKIVHKPFTFRWQ